MSHTASSSETHPARFSHWESFFPLVALLLLVAIGMSIVFSAVVTTYDFRYHAEYARVWYEQGQPPVPLPHVLYHLTLIGLKTILSGSDFGLLSIMVTVIAALATTVLLYAYLLSAFEKRTRRTCWLAAGLTLILMLVAPITVFTWDERNLYFGYIAPNIYHNPTSLFIKPMTLALFWLASDALEGRQAPRRVWIAAMMLSVLMPIGKPNYTLALLPGLAVLLLWRLLRREPVKPGLLIFGIFLPSLLILLYQFVTFSGQSQLAFSPFTVFRDWGLTKTDLLRGTLLSLLYPLLVVGLFPRQAARAVALQLVWSVMFIALFQMFTLVEGRDPSAMNWNWGALLNAFILFATTTRFLIMQRRLTPLDWRWLLIGMTLSAHFICGVVWFGFHI